MIAIDTNVLLRILVNDSPQQTTLVKTLFSSHQHIYISRTVLLETEWVLRATYKIQSTEIQEAFTKLANNNRFVLENKPQLTQALNYYQNGMDFADALHLVNLPIETTLYTFDKKFVKSANKMQADIELLK